MAAERPDDADSGVLTREAFGLLLGQELQRALRSQEFLTLIRLEIQREWEELMVAADEWMVKELGELVKHQVREVDILARTAEGVLWLVLLGADYERARRVVDRVITHIQNYRSSLSFRITFGAASYPTHAADAEELLKQAVSRPLQTLRAASS
jgi:GGDEF domain-containing protein